MVKEAVIFIESLEKDCARPNIGIGGQRIQHAGGEFSTLDRGRSRRMFGPLLGWQYPGHGWQRPILHILRQLLKRPVAHASLIKRITRLGIAKAFESKTTVHGSCPVVVGVLIDTPVDAML